MGGGAHKVWKNQLFPETEFLLSKLNEIAIKN